MTSAIDPAISNLLAAQDSAAKTQIAFALAAKARDTQKQQGDALAKLIDAAGQIGKATDRGTSLDVTA